jgi:hypothetical protein
MKAIHPKLEEVVSPSMLLRNAEVFLDGFRCQAEADRRAVFQKSLL